ncbi:MAG: hypothetical protein JST24_11580 [Acidobacteria bacterium]|nr:hypothetical protein [Acidobacteriota bacterium]
MPRILLLGPTVQGLDPQWSIGVGKFLQDELEIRVDAPVLPLGSTTVPSDVPPQDLVVRFSGQRDASLLALKLEWIRGKDLHAGLPWSVSSTPLCYPTEAFRQLWGQGPWPSLRGGVPGLLPEDADGFWELVRQFAIVEDVAAVQDLDAARRLAQVEPHSAAVWANLGEHLYRYLWTEPSGGDMPQLEVERALGQALNLIPDYPRAALLQGMLLTDLGDQRTAGVARTCRRSLYPPGHLEPLQWPGLCGANLRPAGGSPAGPG